jgi:hypothetical protein
MMLSSYFPILSIEKIVEFFSKYASDYLTSIVCLVIFYQQIKPTTDKSEKRLAWILTLFCSVVCTFTCIPFVINGFKAGWPAEIIYGNPRFSIFLLNFFVSYLLVDSYYICVDYPSIGGFYHHIPYLIFMLLSIYFECQSCFVTFFPLELSTIFLASGQIWPSCRVDIPFGMTFFLSRIVYHGLLWFRLYHTRNESPFLMWPFAILPWLMHVHWFYKWCRSYLKKLRAKKD